MVTSKSVRIAFMGGASMTWVPSFGQDLTHCQALAGSTMVLMDPDRERVGTMKRYLERMVRERGADLTIEATSERAEALSGADYVINTFGPGGHVYWKHDVDISLRYGIQHPAGMSVGPAGLMQGLKGIPAVLDIAHDMETLCPEARLINYTNPMSSLTLAFNRYSQIKGVGVCPGIYTYIERKAQALGIEASEVSFIAGGVNHMTWLVQVRHGGRDLLPEFRRLAKGPQRPEPIHALLYDLYGAWPTPSEVHVAEFVPFFIGKGRDVQQKYGVAQNYIENRIENRKATWAAIEAAAAGNGPLIANEYASQERADIMMQAIELNEPCVVYLNVLNRGAIANVAPGACVEVPTLVDRLGFHPVAIGELPPGAAAITNLAATVQDLTVEAAVQGDRRLALQALTLDPMTYTLDLAETEALLDEMLAASRPVLPRFFA